MNKKKLLFLTHYFPPEVNAPANRTYEHCRLWKNELDITVITNFPNHPDGKIYPGYKNKLYQKEIIDGINVIRLWTFLTPNEGFILRTLNYIIYMLMAVSYVIIMNIDFDLIIATTPQFFCGLAGKYIAKLKRKPFILELRDIWPESIVAVGALSNKAIISFLEGIELRLYNTASKIISVTQSFKDTLVKRGIAPEKIDVIYNGISVDLFGKESKISNDELSEYVSSGYVIGYIGTIGMAHSIITLINAAEKANDDIKFVVVGSGAQRLPLEELILEKKLKNIKIFPNQPKADIPAIINSLNLFCIHLKKNNLFKTVIPSKMFEGMMAKKPLLMGVDGEARRIVEESESGTYFEPENEEDLLNKISLYRKDNSLYNRHAENGFVFVQENFNRQILAGKFLNIIKSLLSN